MMKEAEKRTKPSVTLIDAGVRESEDIYFSQII